MDHYDVIQKPIILTEKGAIAREKHNQYLFQVHPNATKTEVKEAIETLFKVNVTNVNTMIYRGKIKKRGKIVLKRPNWKKAVVTLGPDDAIDFFEGA